MADANIDISATDDASESLDRVAAACDPCNVSECERRASKTPVLQLRAEVGNGVMEAPCSLRVCDVHAELLTVAEILNDDAWRMLAMNTVARGHQPPARDRTTVRWTELDDGDGSE